MLNNQQMPDNMTSDSQKPGAANEAGCTFQIYVCKAVVNYLFFWLTIQFMLEGTENGTYHIKFG